MLSTKAGYILVGAGIFIFLVSLTIFISSKTNVSAQQETLEDCKTLQYSQQSGINILYFGQKEQAEEYTSFFLQSEPFSDYKDSFNFFYIDSFEPSCSLYKNIALYCYSRDLIKKAASCPHDFIIVLDEESISIRSSSYLNLMSINSNHVLTVLLHEFGHSFANRAEEYVNNQNPARGSNNCQGTCEGFGEEKDGCYEGCSKTEFYRSINGGVMRTLESTDYGMFNDLIIRSLIEQKTSSRSAITGNQILDFQDCSEQKYSLFKLNSNLEIESATEHVGCPGTLGEGSFSYQIKSQGQLLESGKFNPTIFTDVQAQGQSEIHGEMFEGEEIFITTSQTGELLEVLDEDLNVISSRNIEFVGAEPCVE